MAESTSHIVQLQVTADVSVPARVWEATTETGVKCLMFVTRVRVNADDDNEAFERELQECPHMQPGPDAGAVDLRLIL